MLERCPRGGPKAPLDSWLRSDLVMSAVMKLTG